MMDGRVARDILDMAILADLNNLTSMTGSKYDYFFGLDALGNPDVIPREMVRAICRDLTNRGYARYMRGLFSDDGVPAGSGYGMTPKGHRYLVALQEIYGPQAAKAQMQQDEPDIFNDIQAQVSQSIIAIAEKFKINPSEAKRLALDALNKPMEVR